MKKHSFSGPNKDTERYVKQITDLTPPTSKLMISFSDAIFNISENTLIFYHVFTNVY